MTIAVVILLLFITVMSYFKKNKIIMSKYYIKTPKITENFRIIFVSDLHLKRYRHPSKIVNMIKKVDPKLVLIGGDLITTYPAAYEGVRNRYSWLENITSLFKGIEQLCPIYYVDGNHEIILKNAFDHAYMPVYKKYEEELIENGMKPLHNCVVKVKEAINIYGYEQEEKYYEKYSKCNIDNDIEKLWDNLDSKCFNVLLTHNPKYFQSYVQKGFDLVLAGHVHGGVVKCGNKGLIGPDRRLFPQYCYGVYEYNGSKLIVTSGMGEHKLPFRIFNPYEIVQIELMTDCLDNNEEYVKN